MDTVYLSPLNETYGMRNLSGITMNILKETDHLFDTVCLQENFTELDFLTEAVENNKNRLVIALEKMVQGIQILAKKFTDMGANLAAKNKKWLENAKSKRNNIPDKFSIDIFPYWKSADKLKNYRFPEFQESTNFVNDLSKSDEFKKKYFKDLFVTEGTDTRFDPTTVFQGGSKQVKMDRQLLASKYMDMIGYIENYPSLCQNINVRNNKVIDFIKKTISRIKSTPFRESNEILATVNQLLLHEAGDYTKPDTVNDVKTEQGKEPGGASDPKKDDNRENGGNPDKESKDNIKAREDYNRIIYDINGSRMSVAEQCYNAYVKAIHLAIKS